MLYNNDIKQSKKCLKSTIGCLIGSVLALTTIDLWSFTLVGLSPAVIIAYFLFFNVVSNLSRYLSLKRLMSKIEYKTIAYKLEHIFPKANEFTISCSGKGFREKYNLKFKLVIEGDTVELHKIIICKKNIITKETTILRGVEMSNSVNGNSSLEITLRTTYYTEEGGIEKDDVKKDGIKSVLLQRNINE